MQRLSRTFVAFFFIALFSGAPLVLPEERASLAKWHTGPCRYLLTRSEAQAFKQLDSEADRAAFIRSFWVRRDPTPETALNEFREQFEKRVRETEALRLYQATTKEMWRTDLGKIFILLGPAVSQQRDQNAASERDMVIWTYDSAHGVRESNFNVVFVADESGELRLSNSPLLDRMTTQGLANPSPNRLMRGVPKPPPTTTGAKQVAANLNMMDTAMAAARGGAANYLEAHRQFSQDQAWGSGALLDRWGHLPASMFLADPNLAAVGGDAAGSPLVRAERVASVQAGDRRPLEESVRARGSFEFLTVALRTDFYRAEDGTTYTAFTLGPMDSMSREVVARLRPFGGIISLDNPRVTYSLSRTDLFAAAGSQSPGTFQTGLGIDPGRYRILFGLEDPATGRVGIRDETMQVPDLQGATLSLSSLTPAQELRALDESEKVTSRHKVPFVLGSLRVVPRPEPTFRREEEFLLYYQVYGAAQGTTGPFDLEAAYHFATETADGWKDLGEPIPQTGLTGAAQAWGFPLEQWPSGRFRLTVTVTDRTTGNLASGSLIFEVSD